MILIAYQTLMAVSYNFLPGMSYVFVHSFLSFCGSFIVFLRFHIYYSHYNEKVLKLYSLLSSINLWTATMLIFANVLIFFNYLMFYFLKFTNFFFFKASRKYSFSRKLCFMGHGVNIFDPHCLNRQR